MENTAILDAIIWTARNKLREVHIATLDLSKAFDHLSHQALLASIQHLGLPTPFIKYVARMYEGTSTILQCGGGTSPAIRVRRGVRQADPLSPLLFNLACNKIIRAMHEEVGFILEGARINALAFADDLVLITTSKIGLSQGDHHRT